MPKRLADIWALCGSAHIFLDLVWLLLQILQKDPASFPPLLICIQCKQRCPSCFDQNAYIWNEASLQTFFAWRQATVLSATHHVTHQLLHETSVVLQVSLLFLSLLQHVQLKGRILGQYLHTHFRLWNMITCSSYRVIWNQCSHLSHCLLPRCPMVNHY